MDGSRDDPLDHAPGSRTHWSRLVDAGSTVADRESARSFFFQRYRGVLYGFFRRSGESKEDAEDLVQEFFASAIERDFLGRADPARGRFRSYLRAAAERFLTDARRTRNRQKRRPEGGLRRLDRVEDGEWRGLEPADDGLTPERAFDRDWARALIDGTFDRLADWYRARGREADFVAFRSRVCEGRSSREISTLTGIPIERVDNVCDRARRRFGDLLRSEVETTVGQEDTDDEIGRLMELFRL